MNYMSSSYQSWVVEGKLNAALYQQLYSAAKKKALWVRFTALPIALTNNLGRIATRVALIAENILKGLGNILGFMFFKNCKLSKGLNQLIVQFPKHTLILPFTVIKAIFLLIGDSFAQFFAPETLTAARWDHYGRTFSSKAWFKEAQQSYTDNSEDIRVIRNLGDAYLHGIGMTKTNKARGLKYLKYAANKGDVKSANMLGNYYSRKADPIDFDEAIKWYSIAKNTNAIRKSEAKRQRAQEYLDAAYRTNDPNLKMFYTGLSGTPLSLPKNPCIL